MITSASESLAIFLGLAVEKRWPLVKVKWADHRFNGRKLYAGRQVRGSKVARLYCLNPGFNFAARPLNNFDPAEAEYCDSLADFEITLIESRKGWHH